MSKKQLQIDITTRAQTAEAAKAEQALDSVTRKTKDATAAAKANGTALDDAGTKAQGTNDIIEGLAGSMNGGTGAIGGMTRALQGMARVLGLAGPLGMVAGAVAAVGTASVLMMNKLAAARQELRDTGDDAVAAVPKLSKLDEWKLDFADELDKLAELREGITETTNAANDQFAAMQRLKDAEAAFDLQKIAAAEATALAGTQDPTQREQLKLGFQRERLAVTQGRAAERAAESVTAEETKLGQLDATMAQLTTELATLADTLSESKAEGKAARAQAAALGIKSDQERQLAELANLDGMGIGTRTAKQQARFVALQGMAPAAREQLAGDRQTYDTAEAETQAKLAAFDTQRRRAYEVTTAHGGVNQDPGPEVAAAFEAKQAKLLQELQFTSALPGTLDAERGAQETHDAATGPIQGRLAATQRARGQTANALQVARIQQKTVAERQRAEYTVQTTVEGDSKAKQTAAARRQAQDAELAELRESATNAGAMSLDELSARADMQGEVADVASAEGALADFEGSNNLAAGSMSTRRTRERLQAAIAAERKEVETLAANIERLANERAANVRAMNQRIENLQGQIENTP